MSTRSLPVRPNLNQLKHQAKDLLRAFRNRENSAVEEFAIYHPEDITPTCAKLSDAQLVLARSYEAPNWTRLVQACRLTDAIWRDDIDEVRQLVTDNPQLLRESALIRDGNWGPPLSYAANLGRDEIIKMLYELGARDLEHALDRACLQSKIQTARMLCKIMEKPRLTPVSLSGPAYTLSPTGTALILEHGVPVIDENGSCLAPVDVVLETDSRRPTAKHEILELYVQHGLTLPDTPTMALHRGRVDLLEEHLRHDPKLLERTFTHEEIYPPELRCHDEVLATQGTPLAGSTLLHLCADYDEIEIAEWLLERGMKVDALAAVNEEGFGGHTALFGTVVSQPNFWMNYQNRPQVAPFTELLLRHGANPNVRASLRKKLHPGYGPRYDVDTTYEYRDVTPLTWGKRFHAQVFVSQPALRLIEERGGHE